MLAEDESSQIDKVRNANYEIKWRSYWKFKNYRRPYPGLENIINNLNDLAWIYTTIWILLSVPIQKWFME